MTSKVLYVENLPSHWTEDKLRQQLAPFGDVRKIVLLRKRNAIYAGYNPTTLEPIRATTIQALIEVSDVEAAVQMLQLMDETPLVVDDGARTVTASYSKNQELRERHTVVSVASSDPHAAFPHHQLQHHHYAHHHGVDSNRILLVTVQNPTYPITTDLMYGVFQTYGTVEKIVTFVKPVGLQCLVQFASLDEAIVAKHALNGLSVFPDCCALVIHFSNLPQELIVKENGLRTKDFTNASLPPPLNDSAVNSSNHNEVMVPTSMYGGGYSAPSGHHPHDHHSHSQPHAPPPFPPPPPLPHHHPHHHHHHHGPHIAPHHPLHTQPLLVHPHQHQHQHPQHQHPRHPQHHHHHHPQHHTQYVPQPQPLPPPQPIVPGVGREVVSPVLLMCNLRESVTCEQLFNLFSCYGNVVRVKKLAAKSDHALVQFSNQHASQSALLHLRGFTLLGRSLEISYSKHAYIAIRPVPVTSANAAGVTPSVPLTSDSVEVCAADTTVSEGASTLSSVEDSTLVKEFGHSVNRFTGKYANGTKHIYSPTKILHVSNLDEAVTAEHLREHLSSFQGGEHCKVKLFSNTNGHIQALAEFPSVDAATNVLAQGHNGPLGSRRVKLAFSRKNLHN